MQDILTHDSSNTLDTQEDSQELLFFEQTFSPSFWEKMMGNSSPITITVTQHAVTYSQGSDTRVLPIDEVRYERGLKNSPDRVVSSSESFNVPRDCVNLAPMLTRMLRVRDEGHQSLSTLYEALEYESSTRKNENILAIGKASNLFIEFVCFVVGTFLLFMFSGEFHPILLLGIWICCGVFFWIHGVPTYYVLRESALVEHFFMVGNIKNTFFLKDISYLRHMDDTLLLHFSNGSEKLIPHVKDAEGLVHAIQRQQEANLLPASRIKPDIDGVLYDEKIPQETLVKFFRVFGWSILEMIVLIFGTISAQQYFGFSVESTLLQTVALWYLIMRCVIAILADNVYRITVTEHELLYHYPKKYFFHPRILHIARKDIEKVALHSNRHLSLIYTQNGNQHTLNIHNGHKYITGILPKLADILDHK